MPLIHKQLTKISRLSGFATENAKAGQIVKLLCRGFVNSDDSAFYTYIDGITGVYLSKAGINEQFVSNILILHHVDLSVDIFINELPIAVEFLSKRSVNKGEQVFGNDIADIRRLRFPKIEIKDSDHIIFIFKVGWRFGLFFDFAYDGKSDYKVDTEKLYHDLGSYYKKLIYRYLYKTIQNSAQFTEMLNDGWFPYVELLGTDFKKLSEAYLNKFILPDAINKLIASFTPERIEKITNRWWRNSIYSDKKKLLDSGIASYLQNNDAGFIACIKILYSEIEGILGYLYLNDKKRYTVKTDELLEHLKEKGFARTRSVDPLFLPDSFEIFLQDYLFPRFNVIKGEIKLSRHTSGHGVAEPEEYTKARALQAILILDHISFFIPPDRK